MGLFPNPLKAKAVDVWASAVAFTDAEISHLQNLQIWPSLVCYLRKLHTVILIIGSIVNTNVKCILGILQPYVGYIVSSGDQICSHWQQFFLHIVLYDYYPAHMCKG